MKWELVARERLYTGERRSFIKDHLKIDNQEAEYLWVDSSDSVIVVPVSIVNEQINFLLIEQYRYPIQRRSLEFPGGLKESNEPAEEAAIRELKEETGCKVLNIKFVHLTNESPAVSQCKTHVYLAMVDAELESQNLEHAELRSDLKTVWLTSDELLKKVQDNDITDAKTLAALSVVLFKTAKAKEYLSALTG